MGPQKRRTLQDPQSNQASSRRAHSNPNRGSTPGKKPWRRAPHRSPTRPPNHSTQVISFSAPHHSPTRPSNHTTQVISFSIPTIPSSDRSPNPHVPIPGATPAIPPNPITTENIMSKSITVFGMKPTKLIAVSSIVFVGSALLFGTKKVFSHTETFVSEIRDEVNRLSPSGHEAERIHHLLHDREREIVECHGKLRGLERKANRAREDAETLVVKIEEQEEILARASVVLARHEPVSKINGRHYDRDLVEHDAVARVSTLETLRVQWNTKIQIAEELTRAANQLQAQLVDAEAQTRKKKAELESLDVRLESAKLQALARSMTQDLLDVSFDHGDELAGTWESYVERVEAAELANGHFGRHPEEDFTVAWSAEDTNADVLQLIAAALGEEETGSAVAEEIPTAPAAGPKPATLEIPPGSFEKPAGSEPARLVEELASSAPGTSKK